MNAGRFGQRSASVELYIPVMVYSVEVLPNEGKMTLLEEAAILFIHSTESTGTPIGIDALSAFLGLDENTTYDLVLDLWRKDRVTIDPASGELQLSDMVADAIKADGNALEDLGTAEAPVVADMLFDLVAGSTLPLTKYTTPWNSAPLRARFPKNLSMPDEPYSPYPQPLEGFLHANSDDVGNALSRHPEVKKRCEQSDIFSYTVLKPVERVREGNVKYLGVFFDLAVSEGRLTVVPNDSRAVRMILGSRVAPLIAEKYAAVKETDSAFASYIADITEQHEAGPVVHTTAIESFLSGTKDLQGEDEHLQRLRLGELWGDARAQLAQIAHKFGLRIHHASKPEAVSNLVAEVIASSEGQLIVGLPRKGNNPAQWDTGVGAALVSFLEVEEEKYRWLGLQLGEDVRKGSLPNHLQTASEGANNAKIRASIKEFTAPKGGMSRSMGLRTSGSNALASPVIGGTGGLVLLNGSVLSSNSTQAISLREDNDDLAKSYMGIDRLRMEFEASFEVEGRSDVLAGFKQAPADVQALVARLDAAFDAYTADNPDFDEEAENGPDEPDDRPRDALLLAEQTDIAERLASWTLFEAESAEACFGGEIFNWATMLMRLAPRDLPVCIGLSDPFDWQPDHAFLAALRDRKGGKTFVFLPHADADDDKRKGRATALDTLYRKLQEYHPTLIRRDFPKQAEGAHSLGFVTAPGFGVFAQLGLSRRMENYGHMARGLVTGIRVGGRENTIAAVAGLGLSEVSAHVEIKPKLASRMVPRLVKLYEFWKQKDLDELVNRLEQDDLSARGALPGDVPDEFKRAVLRAEARLGGVSPAFEGARASLAAREAREDPVMAAAVFGPLVDAAYTDLALQNLALAVATGCDLPPGLDFFTMLEDAAPEQGLTTRLLLATLLAQGSRPDLAEQLGEWRTARWQQRSEPDLALDQLIDALVEMRSDVPIGRFSKRVGFVSDRREPETAWQELGDFLNQKLAGGRHPSHFNQFLFAEKEDEWAPLTAKLAHLVERSPEFWSAAKDLQSIVPDGETFDTIAERKRCEQALLATYEPAVAKWLEVEKRVVPGGHTPPWGGNERQFLNALKQTASYLSDICFALSDAGRGLRIERALSAAIDAVKAIEPPAQRTHPRTLWEGMLGWLSEEGPKLPRCPWMVPELIAAPDGTEDRVATALARDEQRTARGLTKVLDDLLEDDLLETERFHKLGALCSALARLDNSDMPEAERKRASEHLRDSLQSWVRGRKRAIDAIVAEGTLVGLSLKMDEFTSALKEAAEALESAPASTWPDKDRLDHLSYLQMCFSEARAAARAAIEAEANNLQGIQGDMADQVRQVARLDDPDPEKARLDFLAWHARVENRIVFPQVSEEEDTRQWLTELERWTKLAQLPHQWNDEPYRDIDMLRWLGRYLDNALMDRIAVESFAAGIAQYLDLESTPRTVEQVVNGWRLRFDSPVALELAPHLSTGEETGLEIFIRGPRLRVVTDAPDAEPTDEELTQRIRILMTLDWTPATTGDRLSLGDLVPAALKLPEQRRKRVAARLIARSDALRGWWRVPRDEIPRDEMEAKGEKDRRERKLATLLGKTVEGLEGVSVPEALAELAAFIPTKHGDEGRDLKFQILAFQAGGSLLNAMDLLFEGIHWTSDGAKSARMLRSSEELLHREISTPVVRRLVDAALPGMRLALDEAGADIGELTVNIAMCYDNERASVETLASALDGSVELKEGARLVDLLGKLVEAGWLRRNGPHQSLRQRDNDGISYLVLTERF